MARLPRIVIPGIPHHVTQRGNRRQRVFFESADYRMYLQTMRKSCDEFGVKILSYSLIPNHVHLIVIPPSKNSLAKAIGKAHEAYTRYINFQKKWRGYLWQGRFASFPMDDAHTYNAIAYVELNAVHAKMVKNPEDYEWSSARAHLGLEKNEFLDDVFEVTSKVENWKQYLDEANQNHEFRVIEKHTRNGRPLGSEEFIQKLEKKLGIRVLPRKPGPKPRK